MPAISFSAPMFTEEDEKAELAAWTQEKRDQLWREVYGKKECRPVYSETPEMVNRGLQVLQEALDSIPDRMEYLTALEGGLVQKETPPIAFLRASNWDAWEAARNLVDNWKQRLVIFGSDKAYQPMTLDGAMQDEIEYLKMAPFVMLPNDTAGRPVLFIDRIVWPRIPKEHLLRCCWYFQQCIVENELTQPGGAIGFLNYSQYDLYRHYDRKLTKQVMKVLRCMPYHIKAVHIYIGGSAVSILSFVLPMMKFMMIKDMRMRCVVHKGYLNSKADLEKYGMSQEHVYCVNAGYQHRVNLVPAWLDQRRETERTRRVVS